jgi:hypothetical protein
LTSSRNQFIAGNVSTVYGKNSIFAVRQYTAGELSRDDALTAFKTNVADNLDVEVDF